jgi:hypothetical protein
MPAYLLSRKQKSLEYFFILLRLYVAENLSLEQIWATRDTDNHFRSLKTLYRYHRKLAGQIDAILTVLSREIAVVNSSFVLPEIGPDNRGAREKLRILFYLLDSLIDILHRKHRSSIILEQERHSYLNHYLWQSAGIQLLDSS